MWDFSSAGWQDALKDFFYSLIKTALVAVGSFAALRLANVHIPVDDPDFLLYSGLIIVGRACVSSYLTWVGTLPGALDSGPADTVTA